jgi:hypothetical protein
LGAQVAEPFLDISLGISVIRRGGEQNGDFAKRTPWFYETNPIGFVFEH